MRTFIPYAECKIEHGKEHSREESSPEMQERMDTTQAAHGPIKSE
jgi:hypothetical protein